MPGKNMKRPQRLESQYLELRGFLSFLILHEVGLRKLCGEDLAKKIGRRKGAMLLTPGTIYPALKELRKKKLIKYKKNGRKKIYELTDEGKKELSVLYKLFSNYFYGLKHRIKRMDYISKE
ncbi:MAG: PadR family transcriptional regulator [Nanoarchaeota archaeon]|nr:PadR family transcriptional regulator [Nanoarchaeota archaeon]MBU1270045.1 PadR family transcriptional regulator [Nanoarchaeota archaeon]MBU1604245.1 PadR family transcriptional regulator [Nanoarchaeota archaeon]MBU2443781.1 PadR family transcriptional regulator [Nanoarchaeota archaeon]